MPGIWRLNLQYFVWGVCAPGNKLKIDPGGKMSEGNSSFDSKWLGGDDNDLLTDIHAIRDYAYRAFDKLDINKNGYIERSELVSVMSHPQTHERERSFISFLLNNQEAIADMVSEDHPGPSRGISREDLESYFGLILNLIK